MVVYNYYTCLTSGHRELGFIHSPGTRILGNFAQSVLLQSSLLCKQVFGNKQMRVKQRNNKINHFLVVNMAWLNEKLLFF